MPTVITTPGASNANSYASRDEANDYHTTRPVSQAAVWYAASDDDKDAALIMATELMDASILWNGSVSTTTQALAFPRNGLVGRNGISVSSSVVPTELKRAQSEFARQLIKSDRMSDNDVVRQGITDLTAGDIKLSFAEDKTSQYVGSLQVGVPKVIPDAVLLLLPTSWYTVPMNAPIVEIEAL